MSITVGPSRREFLATSAAASVGLLVRPQMSFGQIGVAAPMKRPFGRLNFDVTTMGLGGQAAVQWPPPGQDAAEIITKAWKLGINYFDTSNGYGFSPWNYGRAFRLLNMAPGQPGYDEKLRRSMWITTKTSSPWAKNPKVPMGPALGGGDCSVVDDLKRSVAVLFGDGEASYPPGAYVDMMLAHGLRTLEAVDAYMTGLDKPDPKAEVIGAFAALKDYRDGTNLTGLNPKGERLVRHIGFSCHDPAVAMELLQRDTGNVLEGMLIPLNANDFNYFNYQNNAIPVAAAKNVGVILMKVFSRGNMYLPGAMMSRSPDTAYREIGSKAMPSRSLVEYSLSTPGVHVAIIGIDHIDADPKRCQLTQNLSAAQIAAGSLSETDRRAIEAMAAQIKDGNTNAPFQPANRSMSAAREVAGSQETRNGQRTIRISWQSAYAGADPIAEYQVWRGNSNVGRVPHRPQTTKAPFTFEEAVSDRVGHRYRIIAVDAAGQQMPSTEAWVPAMA
jgi:aryl-alcohol dehydrogenase-like predicted oxidoreductase